MTSAINNSFNENNYYIIFDSNNCQIYRPKRTSLGEDERSIIVYKSKSGDIHNITFHTSNARDYQLARIGNLLAHLPDIQQDNLVSNFKNVYLENFESTLIEEFRKYPDRMTNDIRKDCTTIELERLKAKVDRLRFALSIPYSHIESLNSKSYEKTTDHNYYNEDLKYITILANTEKSQLKEALAKEGFDEDSWRIRVQRAFEDINHPAHQLLKAAKENPENYHLLHFALERVMDDYYSHLFPPSNQQEAQQQINQIKQFISTDENELSHIEAEIAAKEAILKRLTK